MPPFLAMTGSMSDKGRVVVMDGFAGRGRYSDGSPGSAELIMQAVQRLQGSRAVAAFFAETDPGTYRMLEGVVGEYAAKGFPAKPLSGSADEHLDAVITAARDVPLFLFLDPCGALLPFSRLARMIGTERRKVRPPTEVLLNFSADFTRRTAGQLAAGRTSEAGVSADGCDLRRYMVARNRDARIPFFGKGKFRARRRSRGKRLRGAACARPGGCSRSRYPCADDCITSLSITWYSLPGASTGSGYSLTHLARLGRTGCEPPGGWTTTATRRTPCPGCPDRMICSSSSTARRPAPRRSSRRICGASCAQGRLSWWTMRGRYSGMPTALRRIQRSLRLSAPSKQADSSLRFGHPAGSATV